MRGQCLKWSLDRCLLLEVAVESMRVREKSRGQRKEPCPQLGNRGRSSHEGGRGGAGAMEDHGQSSGVGTQGEKSVENQEAEEEEPLSKGRTETRSSVSQLTCRGGTRGLGTLV